MAATALEHSPAPPSDCCSRHALAGLDCSISVMQAKSWRGCWMQLRSSPVLLGGAESRAAVSQAAGCCTSSGALAVGAMMSRGCARI